MFILILFSAPHVAIDIDGYTQIAASEHNNNIGWCIMIAYASSLATVLRCWRKMKQKTHSLTHSLTDTLTDLLKPLDLILYCYYVYVPLKRNHIYVAIKGAETPTTNNKRHQRTPNLS